VMFLNHFFDFVDPVLLLILLENARSKLLILKIINSMNQRYKLTA
jgi:hypothetical protein